MNEKEGEHVFRRFEGRSVMVTGAGTGFGAEIATRAAQEGAATVVVHYNTSRPGAERTAERVAEAGAKPLVVQGDITSYADIRRMADTVAAQTGGLDVLVNNVGDIDTGTMSWRELTEEAIDRVLAVDIKGTMLMVHEFGQRMVERGGGAIVNIGSTVVVRGSARAPHYAAGKYGLLGITKSYAAAFAPTVRVNVFAPGFMETESTLGRQDWKEGRREKLLAMTPMKHIPKPAELAGTALFLASADAAHMTGAYVVADGGFNMVGA
ncbi:SDR family NAD(P)-dependent oxidoreductase [Phytohabitans suffuscus]|uniref:Beta-ketoacyl-ACP reductase n=1 Tax=Phytohabitans suffuscus TaxID=624315 RepID=A0A6F8Z0I9_9ACTN|nr:SDR family oxidoreductase [Phytohabitans suffuscus]BCB91862.1 beta-ketoacyl-ACP reductase [Phytohabitans suffuscus]